MYYQKEFEQWIEDIQNEDENPFSMVLSEREVSFCKQAWDKLGRIVAKSLADNDCEIVEDTEGCTWTLNRLAK